MQDEIGIREHMAVIGADGTRLGTVDALEGDTRIKLARADDDDDVHHYIPLDWVERIDRDVHLNLSADEARRLWD